MQSGSFLGNTAAKTKVSTLLRIRDEVRQSLMAVTTSRFTSTHTFWSPSERSSEEKVECFFSTAAARCHARVMLPRHQPLFIRPREDSADPHPAEMDLLLFPTGLSPLWMRPNTPIPLEKKRSHRSGESFVMKLSFILHFTDCHKTFLLCLGVAEFCHVEKPP